jgi:putative Mg2+ transporter-C (MgtC) family protein
MIRNFPLYRQLSNQELSQLFFMFTFLFMDSISTICMQLGMVVLVGGIIGAEREYHSKSAGFRTVILICLGSYLFSLFSVMLGGNSPDRIAANVVTGIGFLGAGVIFRSDKKVNGITTAATIWATAALGMGVAMGHYKVVFIATGLVLAALFLFSSFERVIDKWNLARNYKIVSEYKEHLLEDYEEKMKSCGLKFKINCQTRKDIYISGTWWVNGKEIDHDRFVEMMLHDETVKEFEF